MDFTVTASAAGRTLMSFLKAQIAHLPLSRLERALREKDISVNGKIVRDRKLVLHGGDLVSLQKLALAPRAKVANPRLPHQLSIIFEDENILVLNKPAGIDMHEGPMALDKQVLAYLSAKQSAPFAAALGQLDKVTSGLIIYGKNYQIARALNEAQAHFYKHYIMKSSYRTNGEITVPLMHNELKKREEVSSQGKLATTQFFVVNNELHAALVTGRKHQIRATLAYLKAPIEGDVKYGGTRAQRVYLHAYELKINGLDEQYAYLNGKIFKSNPEWHDGLKSKA